MRKFEEKMRDLERRIEEKAAEIEKRVEQMHQLRNAPGTTI